jgi:hypothetical protein
MSSLKPLIPISILQDDQISTLLTSPTSIVVVGTVSNDGYVASFDRTGVQQWSTRLGGTPDEIATTAVRDASGNIWVAGATAIAPAPISPSQSTQSSVVLNPGGVVLDTETALPTLTQLNIWKVSAKGALLNTYNLDFKYQVFPQSITAKSGKVTVQGSLSSNPLDQFTTTLDSAGVFTTPKVASVKTVPSNGVIQVKTKLSIWKSFVTSSAIKGLPSWKPKPSSQVLVRYDIKTGAVVAAYLASGEIIDFKQEPTIGIIVLGLNAAGYYLVILK